jgi:hypothetical protein
MKRHLAIATLLALTAGATYLPAQFTPGTCTGQQQGQRKGKKLGKQDGSGPQHQPGTGGGTGPGQRRFTSTRRDRTPSGDTAAFGR